MCCNKLSGSHKIDIMTQDMPLIKLNNGNFMPQIGFGTWLSKPNVAGESVKMALHNGYQHIDCAKIYRNESEVGPAIADYLASPGAKSRDKIYVTSKLWVKDYDRVRETCVQSLKDLQLEYLDLYLIHMPWEVECKGEYGIPTDDQGGLLGYNKDRINHVWQQLEALVDEGLVKSIGVSNFSVSKLQNILDAKPKHKPAVNQIESHPYLPNMKMMEFCKKNDITMVAFAPLASPGRTDMFKINEEPYLLGDDVVSFIANKHNIGNGMVLLVWAVQRGIPVILKSTNEQRIKDNLKCLQIKLDKEDVKMLNGIETRFRYYQNAWAIPAGGKAEDLWDGDFLS